MTSTSADIWHRQCKAMLEELENHFTKPRHKALHLLHCLLQCYVRVSYNLNSLDCREGPSMG